MPGEVDNLMKRLVDARASVKKAPEPPKEAPMPGVEPPVPTMTSASLIPPLESVRPRTPYDLPDELADDIVAKPLSAPDFVTDIKPFLANPNLSARWVFTDRRRFSQALAQGWRVARKSDLKPGYARLNPFETEGGTKYINGDLILMVIDRKIYLGALRYKHQVAANLSDSAIANRISAQKAAATMGDNVNAVNNWMARQGKRPVMEVFTPGDSDTMKGVMADDAVAQKELSRIGGSRDMGTLADLANKVDQT